jgi:predicted nucleic acid-binding protein
MKTIQISISDLEYNQFGIKSDKLSFSEFVDLIGREITKQGLNRCIELAEKYQPKKSVNIRSDKDDNKLLELAFES